MNPDGQTQVASRVLRTVGQQVRRDGWSGWSWDTSFVTRCERETRRLIPRTVENAPVLKKLRWLLSMAIEPTGYEPYDWEMHSYRTQEHVLEALDRAAVLAETGDLRGRGPE